MIFCEVGNLDRIVAIMFSIMLGPPLILLVTGLITRQKNKKSAKIQFIIAALYLVIGLGYCGFLLS